MPNLVTTPVQDIFTASMLAGDSTVTSTLDNIQQQDFIDGGDGIDTFVLTGGTTTTVLNINLSNTTSQISSILTPGTVIKNFDNFDFSGFLGGIIADGTDAGEIIIGGASGNKIRGFGGNDSLVGGAAGDQIDGGTGNDTMIGGAGDDFYFVDSVGDVIIELAGEGNDSVYSSINYTLADTLENLVLEGDAITGTGNDSNNRLVGNAKNNVLIGGGGSDYLDGGGGIDTLIGGTGDDSYIVNSQFDVVIEQAGEGNDTVVLRTANYYILGPNIENLTLEGDAVRGNGNELNNRIVANGNVIQNFLYGYGGNDFLYGGTSNDQLFGGTGNDNLRGMGGIDLLYGEEGNDILEGGEGNDNLNGGTGNDTMRGGTGNDFYHVDSVGDVVTEETDAGNDTVLSSIDYDLRSIVNVENLTLLEGTAINGTGNDFNNRLIGNSNNNVLIGGAGSDYIDGGTGIDTLIGGIGDDSYFVDNANDVVTEFAGEGTDTVTSSASAYQLGDNLENLTLSGTAVSGTGNSLDNRVVGNDGDNLLFGLAGNDFLLGNAGNDTLTGGAGQDKLRGGGVGVDTFVYTNLSDSLLSAPDLIEDLNAAEDLLRVATAPVQFTANAGNVSALTQSAISAILTSSVFANTGDAAYFTFGSRQFVGINDTIVGFQSTSDAIIEVTGLTGTLSAANFVA